MKINDGRGRSPGSSNTQFQPGKSGNPNGRPKKGFAIADLLRAIGDEQSTFTYVDPDTGKEREATKRMAMLLNTYMLAIKGESWAVNFIAEREDGKVKTSIDLDVEKHVSLEDVAIALGNHYVEREVSVDVTGEAE